MEYNEVLSRSRNYFLTGFIFSSSTKVKEYHNKIVKLSDLVLHHLYVAQEYIGPDKDRLDLYLEKETQDLSVDERITLKQFLLPEFRSLNFFLLQEVARRAIVQRFGLILPHTPC